MYRPVTFPDAVEPLVRFVEETPPDRIVAETYEKLRAGTPISEMVLAGTLAAIRSSDLPNGHHGGPLHQMMGLHPVLQATKRLPGDYAFLPVVQSVSLANRHIHAYSMGPFILPDVEPVSKNDSVEDTLTAMTRNIRRGAYHTCERYFLYLIQQLSPMQVLDHLLQAGIAKNGIDDHNFLIPVYAWRALEQLGWEYAPYLGRTAVRYVTRPPEPPETLDADALIEEYGLLEREIRQSTDEGETPALEALRDEIGNCDRWEDVPAMLARALADGVSLEGVGEGLSAGGSVLFLRSLTANPMDVHIHTGANARRYLFRQPELSLATKLRSLLTWNNGPEVRRAWRTLSPDLQPKPERVAAFPARSQDELLREMEAQIDRLPTERLPIADVPFWRASEEVKEVVAMAQRYVDCGYDPAALDVLCGRIVCRDSFTEMHALKHYQAVYEEYHATRPALRDTHLVSAVYGAAISHGHVQDVYEGASKVMHLPATRGGELSWGGVEGRLDGV